MSTNNEKASILKKWQLVLGALHWICATAIAIYASVEDKDWKTHVYYEYNAWVTNENQTCGSGDGVGVVSPLCFLTAHHTFINPFTTITVYDLHGTKKSRR